MSGEPTPVAVPMPLLTEIGRLAIAAFPAECCGWLSGPSATLGVDTVRPCKNAQEEGDHPTQDGRGADTAYVIAGDDLLALGKSIDSERPAKIIYHSHPNGRAYFSDTDRAVAASPWGDGPAYPVQQLVVGVLANTLVEAALYAWSELAGDFVEIHRWDAAMFEM